MAFGYVHPHIPTGIYVEHKHIMLLPRLALFVRDPGTPRSGRTRWTGITIPCYVRHTIRIIEADGGRKNPVWPVRVLRKRRILYFGAEVEEDGSKRDTLGAQCNVGRAVCAHERYRIEQSSDQRFVCGKKRIVVLSPGMQKWHECDCALTWAHGRHCDTG